MILHGDALAVLRTLPEASAHCAVTSPPYWSLRDYGVPPTVWDGHAALAKKYALAREDCMWTAASKNSCGTTHRSRPSFFVAKTPAL